MYQHRVGLFIWIEEDFQSKFLRFMTDFNPTRPSHKFYPNKGRYNVVAEASADKIELAERKLWTDIQNDCDPDITLPCIVRLVCKISNCNHQYLTFDVDKLFFTTEIQDDPTCIVIDQSEPTENIAFAIEKMFKKLTNG